MANHHVLIGFKQLYHKFDGKANEEIFQVTNSGWIGCYIQIYIIYIYDSKYKKGMKWI